MALTASQARALSVAARSSNLSEIYSLIEDEANLGNSSLIIPEVINADVRLDLETNGFTVTVPPSSTTTVVSWAVITA